jgi:hypothetical protein
VQVHADGLAGGIMRYGNEASSQFLSAILLAGVAVEGGLFVRASGSVASAPYVTMTLETLRERGNGIATPLEGELGEGTVSEREPVAILPGSIGSIATRSRGGTTPRCIRRHRTPSERSCGETKHSRLARTNESAQTTRAPLTRPPTRHRLPQML